MSKIGLPHLEKRREIYKHILKNPGLHFRNISRDLNIPKTTINYHLNYLKKQGLLVESQKNGYLRYYASKKFNQKDREIINILRQTVPCNIVLFLLMYPNSSEIQMIKYANSWISHPSKVGFHLSKHHTTISFHLRKLQNMDIVERVQNGNKVKFRVKNPEDILKPIITYEKSLLGDANNRILKWINNDTGVSERVIDKIFEIFPHPYHV